MKWFLILLTSIVLWGCTDKPNEEFSKFIVDSSIAPPIAVSVTAECNGVSKTLTCGWGKGATEGYDVAYNESPLPPIPPYPSNDFRFVSTSMVDGSWIDIRPYLSEKRYVGDFTLQCQWNTQTPLVLTIEVPLGVVEGWLVDGITGNLVRVPLEFPRTVYKVTNSNIRTYKLKFSLPTKN